VKTTFFIARHGETEWNTHKRLQGQLDSPLTLNGRNQAQQLAQIISQRNIDAIYSSPLQRAVSTAQVCSSLIAKQVKTHPAFLERNFGDWQGKLFDDLKLARHFKSIFHEVTCHAPPNGESGIECKSRMQDGLKLIAQTKADNILIISHGDLIRCFLADLTSNVACDAYSQYGNGSVFKVLLCHQTMTFEYAVDDI
jgi:broad specificity phosphatase PhoE